MSFDIYFNKTCEVLDIKECLPSHEFINPCSCYDSYYCNNYEVKTRPCPEGTAYNGKICDHVKDVLVYNCSIERPWDRCNVSDARLGELAYMCGGSTTPSTTTEKITPVAGPGEDNLGLIIGLAIAGVIIIIFAVILIIIFMRIRKTKLIEKTRQGTVQNPEYFEDGNRDDPYAIIDDSRVNNHMVVHIDREASYMVPQSNRSTENGTLQGSTIADTLPPNIDTVYDNSASFAEPPSGYELTGNTQKSGGTEPPYYTLIKEQNNDTERTKNTLDSGETDDAFIAHNRLSDRNANEFSSIVTDDAIKLETNGTQGYGNSGVSVEDDSPYNG